MKNNLIKIKSAFNRNLVNYLGWKTNRKIIVFESDDWGSIRMPSKEVYAILLKKGINVDKCPFCKYDSLASETDLTFLFNLLTSFKDIHGKHPVITANTIVANPNFKTIQQSDFQAYAYEPFTETLKQYPNHDKSFDLWEKGISLNIFKPQYHGREHLNVNRWMNNLRESSKETMLAFNHKLFGLSTTITSENRRSYMAAFEYDNLVQREQQLAIIENGISLFHSIFNYSPTSFIAPNYKWNSSIEPFLYDQKIRSIQGLSFHKEVETNSIKSTKKIRYTGAKEKSNLLSLVRNAFFEPSINTQKDWVDSCLNEISNSFRWKKPAIICSHRVNFIGAIDETNRDRNLRLLHNLLREIMKKWEDVEFLSSDELASIILNEKK